MRGWTQASCRLTQGSVGALSGEYGGGRGGRGSSLRGLVDVRPQNGARYARYGFDALGKLNAGATDAGQDLAQVSWGDLQLLRQRGLRQSIVLNIARKGIHASFVAQCYAAGKDNLHRT